MPGWLSRPRSYYYAGPVAVVAGLVAAAVTAVAGAPVPLVAGVSAAASSVPGPMPGAPHGRPSHPAPAPPPPASSPPPAPMRPQAANSVKVSSWNAGSGGRMLGQVTAQAGAVLMAEGAGKYSRMLQLCQALSASVKSAQSGPPIPDSGLQALYASSLTTFKLGVASCLSGITQTPNGVEDTVTHVDKVTIAAAVKQLGSGQHDLFRSTGFLRKR